MTSNTITQAVVLPFVDLTLISCNCATAIIANIILSTKVLGENFIWQYDLTAMMFIVAGTLAIIFQCNTEQKSFTGEEIKDLVFSLRTLIYITLCVFFFIIDRICLRIMLEKLRLFEADANAYDEEQRRVAKNQSRQVPASAINGLGAVAESESQLSQSCA